MAQEGEPSVRKIRMAKLRPRQGGYILATTAMMLIPLMVFAAFAVDVGGWYVSADEAQRAADAAALAASVKAPNAASVQTEAVRVAALNGLVDQPDGPGPDGKPQFPQVTSKVLNSATVEVRITVEGESHFGQIVMDSIPIERYAVAELTRPLPMGQPTSALGTGVDTIYPGETNNFWLNIHDPTTPRRSGDHLSANLLASGFANPWKTKDSTKDGYLFGVNIPNDGQVYDLQVRITCFKPNSNADGEAKLSLHVPDNTFTPNYIRDNLTVPAYSWGTYARTAACSSTPYDYTAAEEGAVWQTVMSNMGSVATGDWLLQAQHAGSGRLLYSLRVVNQSGSPHCTVITNSTCATVRPINWLGIFTDDDMFGGADPSTKNIELYLAEVGPENYRSTLEIFIFDTADGIDEVQILLPPRDSNSTDPSLLARNVAPMTWGIVDDNLQSTGVPAAGQFRQCADTSYDCLKYPTFASDRTWFNDQIVRLEIDLANVPGGYACTSDCWVKVQYTASNTIGETTGWQANIIGDPLRLIE